MGKYEDGRPVSDATDNSIENRKITCDEEAWLYNSLSGLVRQTLALNRNAINRADEHTFDAAVSGAIDGTILEILHTLGIDSDYVNIPNPRKHRRWHRPIDSGCTLKY